MEPELKTVSPAIKEEAQHTENRVDSARNERTAVPPPLIVSMQPEQFQLFLAKLRDEPRNDWRSKLSKGFDIFQKVLITVGLGLVSSYIGCQEFSGKKKEAQAKMFGELYAEKEETRLGAAAAAVKELDGSDLAKFVKLAVARFDDFEPKRREYAESGVVNMASFSYEPERQLPIIVDALADGLDPNKPQDTKERAAEAAGRIGFPTLHLVQSATRLLEVPDNEGDVVKEVCLAVKSLRWTASSRNTVVGQIAALREAVAKVALNSAGRSDIQGECSRALANLPSP